MPLVLNAEVSGDDSNSLVTLAQADSYFGEELLTGAAWDLLSDSVKEKALVTASKRFCDLVWWGIPTKSSQSMPFPRYLCGVDEGLAVPKEIVWACCEHALDLAQQTPGTQGGKRERMRAAGVTSYRLGDSSETYAPLASGTTTEGSLSQFSARVQRLISSWVRTAWNVDSGRRPRGNGLRWPEVLR